ncbi:MAG: complexin-2 [Anaerovoracaceae bacterium]
MKNIQITEELFIKLLRYHLKDETDLQEEICAALNEKLERAINRIVYTKYKTADTETEKEKARQEYLDRKGYHKDFRW